MYTSRLEEYREELNGMSCREVLEWALKTFESEDIAMATSFGAEDQVLTHIIAESGYPINLFSLDTGRLPDETYQTMEKTSDKYGIDVEILFPDKKSVEDMVNKHGPNLFYRSVLLREECCRIRKLESLKNKLGELSVWITGLRSSQSVTRRDQNIIEWDNNFNLYKLSPLLTWSEDDVWEFIRSNRIPYNPLHDSGYPSIGCAPCTRAVLAGEDIRAGRWWWENPETRECGLHRSGRKTEGGS